MNKTATRARTANIFQGSNTVSPNDMKNFQTNSVWPPKYTQKHEKLKEIPKECIQKLLTAMDKDMDGKISFDEMLDFIKKNSCRAITPEIALKMFKEITKNRNVTFSEQKENPFTLEELISCCIFLIKNKKS